jgi:hypothetical protein
MRDVASKKKIARGLPLTVLGMAACLALSSLQARAEDASGARPPAGNSVAVPGAAPGLMIYVDPRTGALLKEPAPGTLPLQVSPQFLNSLSTSHQGLVETPSAVPGGGVKVDLQGRFQSPMIATVDANGKLKIQHIEPSQSGDKK